MLYFIISEDLDNNRNSQLLYSLLSEEGVFQVELMTGFSWKVLLGDQKLELSHYLVSIDSSR